MGNSKSRQVEQWFTAARTGDVSAMASLLAENPSLVNAFNTEGWTALHLASKHGHERVVALLLAEKRLKTVRGLEGSSPYGVDRNGWNALHLAVSYGHERVVALLLTANPKLVRGTDFLGRTPFHVALRFSQEGMVAMLQWRLSLDELVSICRDCKKSYEPFLLAAERQCEGLLQLLNQDVATIVFAYIGLT